MLDKNPIVEPEKAVANMQPYIGHEVEVTTRNRSFHGSDKIHDVLTNVSVREGSVILHFQQGIELPYAQVSACVLTQHSVPVAALDTSPIQEDWGSLGGAGFNRMYLQTGPLPQEPVPVAALGTSPTPGDWGLLGHEGFKRAFLQPGRGGGATTSPDSGQYSTDLAMMATSASIGGAG
jgi:hypothetical protein